MDPSQPITNQPSTQRLILNQLRRQFRQGTGRQMTINDLPHWRDLELPPNPTDTTQEQYLQSLGAYLRAHMPPRESHRTFAADPRDPREAEVHTTQQSLREDFQLAILLPADTNTALRHFLDTYTLVHGYPPQPEDVPHWPTFSFLLPSDHIITPELTQEFHNLMYSRMLPTHTRPIPPPPAPTNPTDTHTTSTTTGNIPTPPLPIPSSPPTLPPMPPPVTTQTSAIVAATPLRDPSPNQRTSVKASPDLSDIRRSKARAAHNTRSNRLLCCNCHLRPPAQSPTCARSGLPMHPGCVQNGTQPPICQSCDTCILDIHDEL